MWNVRHKVDIPKRGGKRSTQTGIDTQTRTHTRHPRRRHLLAELIRFARSCCCCLTCLRGTKWVQIKGVQAVSMTPGLQKSSYHLPHTSSHNTICHLQWRRVQSMIERKKKQRWCHIYLVLLKQIAEQLIRACWWGWIAAILGGLCCPAVSS